VVGQRGVVRVRVEGGDHVLRSALKIAETAGLAGTAVEEGDGAGCFELATGHAPDWGAIRTRLVESCDGVVLEEDLGAVSVVGRAFDTDGARRERALGVLSDAGIEHRRVLATARRLGVLLEAGRVDDAVRALHSALV